MGGIRTVELFNGPAGYSSIGYWGSFGSYQVNENQTPTASTVKFPAGNYVWKITDDCGVYYLPITVGAADLPVYRGNTNHHTNLPGLMGDTNGHRYQ